MGDRLAPIIGDADFVGLIGAAHKKLSYQVVADYASYKAILRIALPIKGVARLLWTLL